eukprot:183245_1
MYSTDDEEESSLYSFSNDETSDSFGHQNIEQVQAPVARKSVEAGEPGAWLELILNELQTNLVPEKHIPFIISKVEEFKADPRTTPELFIFFNEFLPVAIEAIISANSLYETILMERDFETVEEICIFLKEIILFCLSAQVSEYGHGLNIFLRIFNKSHRLYTIMWGEPSRYDGEFARSAKREGQVVGSEFVLLVDHFASVGGFETLVKWLNEERDACFADLVNFLTLLHQMRPVLKRKVIERVGQSVYWCVRDRLKLVSQDELRVNPRRDFYKVLRYNQEFCGNYCVSGGRQAATKAYMQLELEVHWIYFNCPNLEDRLDGLREMRSVVGVVNEMQKLRRTGEFSDGADTTDDPFEEHAWSDVDILLEWFREKELVLHILDRKSNLQIVTLSVEILKFLAIYDQLEELHIDMLWNHTVGRPGNQVSGVYTTFQVLSPNLAGNLFRHLHAKIFALDPSKATEPLAKLIFVMALSSLSRYRYNLPKPTQWELPELPRELDDQLNSPLEERHHGMYPLWEVALHAPGDVSRRALYNLVALLNDDNVGGAYRRIYIDLCIQNLEKYTHVSQSLWLMTSILEGCEDEPDTERRNSFSQLGRCSRSKIIQQVELRYDLVNRIFKSMLHVRDEFNLIMNLSNVSPEAGALCSGGTCLWPSSEVLVSPTTLELSLASFWPSSHLCVW